MAHAAEMQPIDKHLLEHERELAALYAISRILATHAGQREMLSEVLGELERGLGMMRSTVMLLSPDGSELIVEAVRGETSRDQRMARYGRGEGVTGMVIQTGRRAVIPRVVDEPLFRNRVHTRRLPEEQEVSFICVPIMLGKEVVGTLAADLARSHEESLDDRARVLEIVAGLIAFDVKSRRQAQRELECLEAENRRLQNELVESHRPENIIGNSNAMRAIYGRIHQVAVSDTTVLIRGESGTGKELVASAIHYSSPRAAQPFIRVNCAALSESLLESELFGHEKGAFTGAVQSRKGRIEEAEGGTLFLDEIGDFSAAIQLKLLRVLQEREYERVGSNKTIRANVRVIAATNADLETAIRARAFRQDLYYRINVFPIFLPPLRDRRDDILQLADHFVEKYSKKMGRSVRRISSSAIDAMVAYHWPGNVRELENCIEHAVLLSDDGVIKSQNLPPTLQMPAATEIDDHTSLTARVQMLEREMLIDALKCAGGNVAAAARQLGITPRIARYKLSKLRVRY